LITILYTEGSAVPAGMQIFQLSADARDLGRTYSTKLALVGDIRASLRALLPLLTPKLAGRREVYAALRKAAEREQEARRSQLNAAADAEFDKPVTTPLVAGREMARAIGPQVAIVDEAPATLGALRCVSEHLRVRASIPLRAPARSAGVCRLRLASHSASTERPWFRSSAMAQRCTLRRHCGRRRTNDFL
jgi:hypothetical protein